MQSLNFYQEKNDDVFDEHNPSVSIIQCVRKNVNVSAYTDALNDIVYGSRETGDFRRYSCDEFLSENGENDPPLKKVEI